MLNTHTGHERRPAPAKNTDAKGDRLSILLHGATKGQHGDGNLDELRKIAKENDVDARRWDDLSPGLFRMNLGNVLRGKINRNERVTINGKSVK